MKQMTEQQALEAFKAAVPPEYDFREVDYTVTAAEGGWDLVAEQMYDYVPFDTAMLFAVCEAFDTMNVNDSRYHHSGCETCDYGSSYTLTLHVREGKPFPVRSTPGASQ